jgi:hypothetical protein
LVYLLTYSEEPNCHPAIRLYKMSKKGLYDLLSTFIRKAFVVDELIGPPENSLLIALAEVIFLFWLLLADWVIVCKRILKFVLILFILIHN